MSPTWITQHLGEVLAERAIPAITNWNRLEGRPRAENFERALRAEVRDALWMLTRQWQLGEFQGDDAGSPIFAKAHVATTRLRRYQANGQAPEDFDDAIPLETRVEARPVRLSMSDQDMSLDLRLLMGRQWLKMLTAEVGDFSAEFQATYPVHSPDPAQEQDAAYCAHSEAWAAFAAASGRLMDGGKLYLHLKEGPGNHAWDGISALDTQRSAVNAVADRWVAWFESFIHQPTGDSAWIADRLEYQFATSAPEAAGERVLSAEEYYHGHLDWYSLDFDPMAAALGAVPAPGETLPHPDTRTLLPTRVSFNGMPNTRWWAFEDGRTNFGDVKPDTTDLAKLLLIEFGLIYANDWFLIPYGLDAGSIAEVRGLAVTNVFGERTWVEPAGSRAEDDWQRWAMFALSTKGQHAERGDHRLLLLPTAAKVQEGRPLEEVMMIRDEVANMVWGVERVVPLPSGEGRPGGEAAHETRDLLERLLGGISAPVPPAEGALIRYLVMSSVPENWIPFIPVHVTGDNREIQLQRAAMPRIIEGATTPPPKVRPRTALLREGLDALPPSAYNLHEEEVPRAGVRVIQSFQRTRWRDGRAWVWLGARKQTGRGEGSSGLAFDRIVDLPPQS